MNLKKLAFFVIVLHAVLATETASAQFTTTLKATSDLFRGHADHIAVSEKGDFIVVAESGRVGKQIRTSDLSLIKEFKTGDAKAELSAICLTQDRYVMVSRPYKKWVTLCDLETGNYTHHKYSSKQYDLAFHPRGGVCFSVGNSTYFKLIAIPGGAKDTIKTRYSGIRAISFSPKGDTLAVGGWHEKPNVSTIELRDDTGRNVLQTLGSMAGHCCSVSVSESGKIVAAGGYEGEVSVWTRGKKGLLFRREKGDNGAARVQLQGERWVWITQSKGPVQLLDLETNKISVPNAAMGNANSLHLLPNNTLVLGGGGGGDITPLSLWSINEPGNKSIVSASPATTSSKTTSGTIKPPTPQQQAKARKLVMDLLEIDSNSSMTDTELDRVSALLLKVAKDEPNQANRYVSLVESARFATLAGNRDRTQAALAAIATQWDVDELAQVIAMLRSSQSVNMTTDKRKQWIQWAVQVLDQAENEGSLAQAMAAGNIAIDLSLKAREGQMATELKARLASLHTKVDRQQQTVNLQSRLQKTPNDPEANFEMGILLCNSGKWGIGFTHLAKSGNAACKTAAERELKPPADAAEKLATARAWAAVSKTAVDKTAENNSVKQVAFASAAFWFDQAVKDLTGLTKMLAQKERGELGELTLKRTERLAEPSAN